MFNVTLQNEDGSFEVYGDVPLEAEHAIREALLGLPGMAVPASFARGVEAILGAVGEASGNLVGDLLNHEGYAPDTGACMCSSLSQVQTPALGKWICMECGHAVHNTRMHCGALR